MQIDISQVQTNEQAALENELRMGSYYVCSCEMHICILVRVPCQKGNHLLIIEELFHTASFYAWPTCEVHICVLVRSLVFNSKMADTYSTKKEATLPSKQLKQPVSNIFKLPYRCINFILFQEEFSVNLRTVLKQRTTSLLHCNVGSLMRVFRI